MTEYGTILLILGISYLAALFISRLIGKLHIPKVTGYLLTGLLLGPSFSRLTGITLFTSEILSNLRILSDIALVLILVVIGSQFKGEYLSRWRSRIFIHSGIETTTTLLFVSVSFFIYALITTKSFVQSNQDIFSFALFTGIIAVATAPAVTLLVVREYESEGAVTDIVLALVGLSNLIAIFIFDISVVLLLPIQNPHTFLLKILISPLLGIAIGFIISFWAQILESRTEWLLLLLGGVISSLALARTFQLDILLCSFAMGMAIANAAPKSKQLFNAIKGVDYPLYVIFFVIAGANLHLDALVHVGLFGIIYIIMRASGKIIGNYLGARFAPFDRTVCRCIGMSMLAHGGVAIGLANTMVNIWPEIGNKIQTIILGSVVVFELIGPIAVRQGLVRAGEVPVLTLLRKRSAESAYDGLHAIINQFRQSLGIPEGHKLDSAHDILICHVMRKNIETLSEDTPFNIILQTIAHSKYDRFPVLDKEDRFIGVVDYSVIRDIIFDASLEHLIVARDLSTPSPIALFPDQTLGQAMALFQKYSDITYVPVVEKNNPQKLVGMINQNDVLAAYRKPNAC